MSNRYPISNAARITMKYLASRAAEKKTEAEKENEALFADMQRRYPEATADLLLLCQSPYARFLFYVHPVMSMRKVQTAMRDGEDYSLLPLIDEREAKKQQNEETERKPRGRKARAATSTESIDDARIEEMLHFSEEEEEDDPININL